MYNGDIELRDVRKGMFLLLGVDPLLSDPLAAHLFCEPEQVTAIHREPSPQELHLLHGDHIVIHARGFGDPTGRAIGVEFAGREGRNILVWYPDDQHLVDGVNLPD